MKRREFIAALGGAAALAARRRAQQASECGASAFLEVSRRTIRKGRLQRSVSAGLQESGWTSGRNLHDRVRWAEVDATSRKNAAELVALAPDVILATGSVSVGAVAAIDPRLYPSCLRWCRSGRRRLRRKLGAAGRQRHRLHAVRIRPERRNGWNCSRRSRPA